MSTSLMSTTTSMTASISTENDSMTSRRYNKVSIIDRQRLFRAYEEDRDYISLAEDLDIKRQTARSIILKYRRTGSIEACPKGGRTCSKMDNEMQQAIVSYVDEKSTITLKEIEEKLAHDYPAKPHVCSQTIANTLDGALYTIKKLKSVPIQWNSPDMKTSRRIFMELMVDMGMQHHLLYLDETGFNIWTARTRGRSPRGLPAVRQVEGQRGRNVTVGLCVSPQYGLVHHTIIEGGMTKETFSDFCMEISALMEDDSFILLMDNARCHDPPHMITDNHKVKMLPKYSPFLNLTELANSCLKAAVKRSLSEPTMQQRLAERDAAQQMNVTLHKYRTNILIDVIKDNVDTITQTKCSSWYRHLSKYTRRCLNEEDIFW